MHSVEPWKAKAGSLKGIQAKVDQHLAERHDVPFRDDMGTWYSCVGQRFQSFDPRKKKKH